MNKTFPLIAILGAALLAGCSTSGSSVQKSTEITYEQVAQNQFTVANRNAIDTLTKKIDEKYRDGAPVLVSTIVNVNNLTQTTALGRTLSEQFASAMVANRFNVKEMKLRESVFIREETGELMLSREIKEIARAHNATLVLVGTHSAADTMTFVSLKVVRTEDGSIVAATDYALPNNRDVRKLLGLSVR